LSDFSFTLEVVVILRFVGEFVKYSY